jgi:hypothetical protein
VWPLPSKISPGISEFPAAASCGATANSGMPPGFRPVGPVPPYRSTQ